MKQWTKDMLASYQSVDYAMTHMQVVGHTVRKKPQMIAPRTATRPERLTYRDEGDLDVWWQGRWHVVEVKGRNNVTFTNETDWRYLSRDCSYPYKSMIVCRKDAFDRYKEEGKEDPHAYFILNAERTHGAVVYTHTDRFWEVESLPDRDHDLGYALFYIAPFWCTKFVVVRGRQ